MLREDIKFPTDILHHATMKAEGTLLLLRMPEYSSHSLKKKNASRISKRISIITLIRRDKFIFAFVLLKAAGTMNTLLRNTGSSERTFYGTKIRLRIVNGSRGSFL